MNGCQQLEWKSGTFVFLGIEKYSTEHFRHQPWEIGSWKESDVVLRSRSPAFTSCMSLGKSPSLSSVNGANSNHAMAVGPETMHRKHLG